MNLSFCEFFGGASEALTLPFRHGCFQVFTSGHDIYRRWGRAEATCQKPPIGSRDHVPSLYSDWMMMNTNIYAPHLLYTSKVKGRTCHVASYDPRRCM